MSFKSGLFHKWSENIVFLNELSTFAVSHSEFRLKKVETLVPVLVWKMADYQQTQVKLEH